MSVETVKANVREGGLTSVVTFEVDDTIEGALQRYGEEVVYSRYHGSLIIDLQSMIRGQLKQGKSQEAIQVDVDNWVPGVRASGASPAEKAKALFGRMTDDERQELLKEFGLA